MADGHQAESGKLAATVVCAALAYGITLTLLKDEAVDLVKKGE